MKRLGEWAETAGILFIATVEPVITLIEWLIVAAVGIGALYLFMILLKTMWRAA